MALSVYLFFLLRLLFFPFISFLSSFCLLAHLLVGASERRCRRRGPKTTSNALSVLLLWVDTIWDLFCKIARTILLSVFLAAQVCIDFGLILEPYFESFLGTEA